MKKLVYILLSLFHLAVFPQWGDEMLSASYDEYAAANADPIMAIGDVAVWWKMEDIPGASNGAAVTSWTDAIGGNTLTVYTGSNPTLEIFETTRRAVKFNDANALYIPEFPAIDFGPTDEFTIVVQLGNSVDTFGTLVGKQEAGTGTVSNPIHYQLQFNTTIANGVGVNLFNTGNGSGFKNWLGGSAHSAKDVYTVAVGAGVNDSDVYKNTTALSIGAGTGDEKGPSASNHNFYVGARGNGGGTIGFQSSGSISNIIIFSKKLTPAQIQTVVDNL